MDELHILIAENRKLRETLTDIAMPVSSACEDLNRDDYAVNQLYRAQTLAANALKAPGEELGLALLTAWFAYNRQNPEGYTLQIQSDGSGRIIGPSASQARYFQSINECITRHLLGDPIKSWEPRCWK